MKKSISLWHEDCIIWHKKIEPGKNLMTLSHVQQIVKNYYLALVTKVITS